MTDAGSGDTFTVPHALLCIEGQCRRVFCVYVLSPRNERGSPVLGPGPGDTQVDTHCTGHVHPHAWTWDLSIATAGHQHMDMNE